MRNYLRVIQYGYDHLDTSGDADRRRHAVCRAEFFFEDSNPQSIDSALMAARALKSLRPHPHYYGAARIIAWAPVPGYPLIPAITAPDRARELVA